MLSFLKSDGHVTLNRLPNFSTPLFSFLQNRGNGSSLFYTLRLRWDARWEISLLPESGYRCKAWDTPKHLSYSTPSGARPCVPSGRQASWTDSLGRQGLLHDLQSIKTRPWSSLVAWWVKDLALTLVWLGSLLWHGLDPWCGFDPSPENFVCLENGQKKPKNKKQNNQDQSCVPKEKFPGPRKDPIEFM